MKKAIGQYEIRDLLGEGGIGQVHAAFDTVLQREVALKSLRPELLSDANFVDRFRAEATSLARLNHPNITTHLLAHSRREESLHGHGAGARPHPR